MTFRRRHRWFRRFALGFALVTTFVVGTASSALAVPDENGSGSQVSSSGGPGLVADAKWELSQTVRPDDAANRFSHADVAPQPRASIGDEWTFEPLDALMIAIGGTVLAIGLALALGYIRRPRIAGL